MKKNFFLAFAMLFMFQFSPLNAQNSIFKKGSLNFSVGYGIVPTFVADEGSVDIPPLSARIGYVLNELLNLSGYFGYSASSSKPHLFDDGILAQYQNDFMIFGLRGELHTSKSRKFYLYGGFMIGYNHPIVKEVTIGDGIEIDRVGTNGKPYQQPNGKILYTGFVGGTYAIQNNIGVFAELGYGISMMNIGLTFKL